MGGRIWPARDSRRYTLRPRLPGASRPAPGPRPKPKISDRRTSIAATRPACVTFIHTADYLPGAIVLSHSVRKHGWRHPLVAMVTKELPGPARDELAKWWDRIVEVESIPHPDPGQMWFPYFRDLYTKLRLWSLTEYDKIVYIDTDVLVTGPLEDLLDRPAFAAAPCQTPSDTLNGGVLVLEPDRAVFEDMVSKIHSLPSHDGSDQGFLNSYFSDWYTGPAERRLPCIYNVNQTLYLARGGWQRVREDMRAIHFVSPAKPWRKRAFRMSHFGYRVMTHKARSTRGPNPMEMWMAAWQEAMGSKKPPWRTDGPWR